MRASVFTLFLLVLMLGSIAQSSRPTQGCNKPITDNEFGMKRKSVLQQPTEAGKLKAAKSVVMSNCLSVKQVRSLIELLKEDANRLDVAKSAWNTTVDKENYFVVLDGFARFSTAFMWYDFITNGKTNPGDIRPNDLPGALNFPPFDYPEYGNYRGPSNCNKPFLESEFTKFAQQVAAKNLESDRMVMLSRIARDYCFSVSQTMKLASLLESESNRLSFFKTVYNSVFDVKNLPFGTQLFTQIPNKTAYTDFINSHGNSSGPAVLPPPCTISANDFSQITETINKESINSTKVSLAKQIIRSKKCFTVKQVSEILRLIPFEDSRLELAKFSYDYTTDRENYYQLADVFSFSQSKEDLMKFLETKR
jgi:hypothetical protein